MTQELAAQAVATAVDFLLHKVVFPATAKLWRKRVAPSISRKREKTDAKSTPAADNAAVEFVDVKLDGATKIDSQTEVEATEQPAIELSLDEAEWRITEAQPAARELAGHLAVLRRARVVENADIPALLAGRGQLEASKAAATKLPSQSSRDSNLEPVRQRRDIPPSPTA